MNFTNSDLWWHVAEAFMGLIILGIVVFLLYRTKVQAIQQSLIEVLQGELSVWKSKNDRLETELKNERESKHLALNNLNAANLMVKDLEGRTDFTPFNHAFIKWCEKQELVMNEILETLRKLQTK